MTIQRRDILSGFLFTSPWFIGFFLFFFYPLSQSIRLAFSNITDITEFRMAWTGFDNFANAFARDIQFFPLLLDSVGNMLANTPIVVVFSLFIAILLNREIRGKGLFRVAFLLPVLLGTGIVMQTIRGNYGVVDISSQMGSASTGPGGAELGEIGINHYLVTLIGPVAAGYLQAVLRKVSEILWMSGIQIILLLGSLQTIPTPYYEAALCDGASEWEKFWKVTLPLTMPTILLVTVYTVIDSFTSADNGVIRYITGVSFANFNLAYGSALSWMYFLLVGIVILAVFAIMRRRVFYMGEK